MGKVSVVITNKVKEAFWYSIAPPPSPHPPPPPRTILPEMVHECSQRTRLGNSEGRSLVCQQHHQKFEVDAP